MNSATFRHIANMRADSKRVARQIRDLSREIQRDLQQPCDAIAILCLRVNARNAWRLSRQLDSAGLHDAPVRDFAIVHPDLAR